MIKNVKNILLFVLFLLGSQSLSAQKDIYGYWVGVLTQGGEQIKFEINIYEGQRSDPTILHCRPCKKIKGSIVDHREIEKIINFYGIINGDRSINIIDSKFAFKEKFEGETRTRYQFEIEIKNGEPWLVGYWQDYNSKGRKVKQGKMYLKREKMVPTRA